MVSDRINQRFGSKQCFMVLVLTRWRPGLGNTGLGWVTVRPQEMTVCLQCVKQVCVLVCVYQVLVVLEQLLSADWAKVIHIHPRVLVYHMILHMIDPEHKYTDTVQTISNTHEHVCTQTHILSPCFSSSQNAWGPWTFQPPEGTKAPLTTAHLM